MLTADIVEGEWYTRLQEGTSGPFVYRKSIEDCDNIINRLFFLIRISFHKHTMTVFDYVLNDPDMLRYPNESFPEYDEYWKRFTQLFTGQINAKISETPMFKTRPTSTKNCARTAPRMINTAIYSPESKVSQTLRTQRISRSKLTNAKDIAVDTFNTYTDGSQSVTGAFLRCDSSDHKFIESLKDTDLNSDSSHCHLKLNQFRSKTISDEQRSHATQVCSDFSNHSWLSSFIWYCNGKDVRLSLMQFLAENGIKRNGDDMLFLLLKIYLGKNITHFIVCVVVGYSCVFIDLQQKPTILYDSPWNIYKPAQRKKLLTSV